jgi:hypothetical protein
MISDTNKIGLIGKLIPDRNPKALVGYYLGFVGLIPIAGFPFGVAAIVLGIMGLYEGSVNPNARGKIHAVVAVVLGIVSITVCLDAGLATLILIYLAKILSAVPTPPTLPA